MSLLVKFATPEFQTIQQLILVLYYNMIFVYDRFDSKEVKTTL